MQPEHRITVEFNADELAYMARAVEYGQAPPTRGDEVPHGQWLSARFAQAIARAAEGETHLPVVLTWEIREDPHYGGTFTLTDKRDPHNGQHFAEISWTPYQGGSVTLDLEDDEVDKLYDALGDLIERRAACP